jgi:hypothetical protein
MGAAVGVKVASTGPVMADKALAAWINPAPI